MEKFMCNVCGKLHSLFNEAALCHPDVVKVDDENLPERAAELLRAADQHEQKCPSCEGKGWNFVHGTTDKKVCSRCNGRGISNRSVGA